MKTPAISALLPLLLLPALLAFCACLPRTAAKLTSEPSIERALDVLNATQEGKSLLHFLQRHPVRFEYSNTPGLCHKFSLKTGDIFLPMEFKNSDAFLALTLARAAYIYRLYVLSGMNEIVSEEEEVAALFQARLGMAINLADRDFEQNKYARQLRSEFCTYIMEGSVSATLLARTAVLSVDPDCQRPLETMQTQRAWLDKTKEAIDNENFFTLMYERDLHLVKKGAMTVNMAMKRDADLRALPRYEIYRYQRTFYDKQSAVFTKLDKLYRSALKEDADWRNSFQADLYRAREEFSACNLPD
ncbi:MAG: hypothetical protein A3J79_05760 [Elusimicrobia bacterium RIFOXYB2_FULL_62_6]|nr:MAG: hypothetical protein A3J79_05760 [Elusimicrobia bacterium RIFOXYB2_FULL_62_6]